MIHIVAANFDSVVVLGLGLELSLRTDLKSLAFKVESLLALILNIFYEFLCNRFAVQLERCPLNHIMSYFYFDLLICFSCIVAPDKTLYDIYPPEIQ